MNEEDDILKYRRADFYAKIYDNSFRQRHEAYIAHSEARQALEYFNQIFPEPKNVPVDISTTIKQSYDLDDPIPF